MLAEAAAEVDHMRVRAQGEADRIVAEARSEGSRVEAEERHRTAAMMQAQLDQVTKLPLLTKTKDGTAIASPYLGIMNRAAVIMIKAASELGFSPAARPRLGASAPQEPSDEHSHWTRLKVIHGGNAAG